MTMARNDPIPLPGLDGTALTNSETSRKAADGPPTAAGIPAAGGPLKGLGTVSPARVPCHSQG